MIAMSNQSQSDKRLSATQNGFMRVYTVEDFRTNMYARLRDIGLPNLHKEHIRLVDIMVELYSEVRKLQKVAPGQEDLVALRSVIDELKGYATKHFANEHTFMTEIKFPGLAQHNEAHKRFVRKLLEIEERIWKQSVSYVVDLLHLLVGWLFEHINQMDMAYVRYSRGEVVKEIPKPAAVVAPSRQPAPRKPVGHTSGKSASDFRGSLHDRLRPTGVAQFDREHRKLIDLISDLSVIAESLYTRKPTPADWQKMDQTLQELTNFARSHFMAEEMWMKRVGYPHLDKHAEQHQHLQNQLRQLTTKLTEERQVTFIVDINFFLVEWLMTHTIKTDMDYGEFAKKKALK